MLSLSFKSQQKNAEKFCLFPALYKIERFPKSFNIKTYNQWLADFNRCCFPKHVGFCKVSNGTSTTFGVLIAATSAGYVSARCGTYQNKHLYDVIQISQHPQAIFQVEVTTPNTVSYISVYGVHIIIQGTENSIYGDIISDVYENL